MPDPTVEHMREFLHRHFDYGMDPDKVFPQEEAIYWFACHYHGGQWSNLYSALSTSEYRPGIATNGPEEGESQDMYDALVSEFGK